MNFMDIMTIKNYNKFGGSMYFAFISLSLFLILAFFSSNLSNVIANLDSNSTLTNSNSTENNINGTIASFPGSVDSDRRHMPVV